MRIIARLLNNKGVALFERVTSRVTIAPGPLSLFDTNGT